MSKVSKRSIPQPRILTSNRELFAGTVNGTPALASMSSFVPIPQLSRNDSDITIIFLSGNGVFSTHPTYDPWYQASTPLAQMNSTGDTGTVQVYRQNEAASPLGCASQWQFCNAYDTACGPLASFQDALSGASLAFEDDAADRLSWFINSLDIDEGTLPGMLEEAQNNALLSTQSLSSGLQGAALPDNQWQLEVTNWFAICLAYMQQTLLETVSGAGSTSSALTLQSPDTTAAKKLCQSQKIRTTKYSSFSFFGVLFTYILGVVVIAVSFALEPILAALHRRRKYKQYKFIEWTTDSTLQLQRLGHDDGDGEWLGCMHNVPTTKAGLQLRGLDMTDSEHPRLVKLACDSEKMTLVASASDEPGQEEEERNVPQTASERTETNPGAPGTQHHELHHVVPANTKVQSALLPAAQSQDEAVSPISPTSPVRDQAVLPDNPVNVAQPTAPD